ncbi:MAG: phosphoglycerate dehydrogenase [Desulfitobacteriaceae bacterium]
MKILVTDKVSELGVAILQREFSVDVKNNLSPEELLQIISEYDALVVRSETKVTKAVLDVATNLKVIGRAGVGVDNIDVAAATQKGVIVLNAPDGNTIAATEHTMAMMMALARNIPQAYRSMKEGKWERNKFMGIEMRGKTLGIIGLGRIGSGVAKRAIAMEMNIMAYDPFITTERATELGIQLADLDAIYAASDFLTFHLPLTSETKGMLNKETFAKMKKGIRLVQCARGGIIVEEDLLEAVKEGIVAGAAIDVFDKEPVDPQNSLLALDNVIYTPHLGASTKEAQVGVAVDVAEGVLIALRGEPVMTAVNMPPIAAQVMEIIKPYLYLAEKMGNLAVSLADGRINSIEVEYNGEISEVDTKMLTLAILKGMLNPLLQGTVNYVSAPVIAKSRGIKIKEVRSNETENFANLISVRVQTDKNEHRVAGTLFGRQEDRIVLIDQYRVDVDPKGYLLIAPHNDRPGIIGKVGNILGENEINITSMQVGRSEEEGKQLMVVGVQTDISNDVLLKIKAVDGILGGKVVNFDA